jgi:hypothetical protein
MKPTLSRLPWCLLIVSLLFLPSAKAQDNPSPISVVQSKMRFDFEPLVQFVLPLSNSSGKLLLVVRASVRFAISPPWIRRLVVAAHYQSYSDLACHS